MSFNLLDSTQIEANFLQFFGATAETNMQPKVVQEDGALEKANFPAEPFNYFSLLNQISEFQNLVQTSKDARKEVLETNKRKRYQNSKGNTVPYVIIAGLAILNAKKEVTSRDIYRFAKHYFSGCVTSSYWKNSIRHVICTRALFQKLAPSSDCKPLSHYWSLDPELVHTLLQMIRTMEQNNTEISSYGLSDPSLWDQLKTGKAGLPAEDIFVDIEEKRKVDSDQTPKKLIKAFSPNPVVKEDYETSSSEDSLGKTVLPSSPSVPEIKEEDESSSDGSREEPRRKTTVRNQLIRPSPYFIPGRPVYPPGFQVPPGFVPKGPFPFGIPVPPSGQQEFYPQAPQFNIIQVTNYFGHPFGQAQSYPAPSTGSASEVIGKNFTML